MRRYLIIFIALFFLYSCATTTPSATQTPDRQITEDISDTTPEGDTDVAATAKKAGGVVVKAASWILDGIIGSQMIW